MVAAATELLQPGPSDTVLDLFCGLGNFTLPLAAVPRAVVGVEGDPALVAKARANAGAQRHRKRRFLRWIISLNRQISALGPPPPTIWCSSIRRAPARLQSWNAWHNGGRAGSCIFPAIRGAWRGMPAY